MRAFPSCWLASLLGLLLVAAPASAWAQAPAAEAARPSFRDARRLDAGLSGQPAMPAQILEPEAGRPAPAPVKAAAPLPPPAPTPAQPELAAAAVKAATTAAPAWLKHLAPGACGVPSIATKALAAGRMQIEIASLCRAGEALTWRYGGSERQATFDPAGRVDLAVDGFAGTATAVEIVLADASRAELPFEALDLRVVTKVALVWRGPADLDLHAFEHAAAPGQGGHVWVGAASSAPEAASRAALGPRGAGFIGSSATGGTGDQVEVYSFVHARDEARSHIGFAVTRKPAPPRPVGPAPDAATSKAESTDAAEAASARPETKPALPPACDPEALTEVPVRIIVLVPGTAPATHRAILGPGRCGEAGTTAPSFDTALLPALRLGPR